MWNRARPGARAGATSTAASCTSGMMTRRRRCGGVLRCITGRPNRWWSSTGAVDCLSPFATVTSRACIAGWWRSSRHALARGNSMREPARKAMATRSAMIIVKTPAEIQQMRLAGVLAAEALREVVRAVRPGVTGTQLNTIAERYIGAAVQRDVEAAGFSVVRDFAGHGIGRALHEEPQVPNFGEPGTAAALREGMTLAIEPMVNLGTHEVVMDEDGWTVRTKDGKPSAHCEHTVAVTADGAMVLTAIPDGVI